MKPNFDKYTDADVDTLNTPYDYKSVMHYGTNYFSINGSDTLIPLDPTAVIGQRDNLSSIDIEEIQIFYGCIPPITTTTITTTATNTDTSTAANSSSTSIQTSATSSNQTTVVTATSSPSPITGMLY